jgi:hypothetical protein
MEAGKVEMCYDGIAAAPSMGAAVVLEHCADRSKMQKQTH